MIIAEPHIEEVIQGNPHTATDVNLELGHNEEVFLLSATGHRSVEQLKLHLLRIQADAAKVLTSKSFQNNPV